MQELFLGFLFIFLDFFITLDSVRIGLLPDFLGYLFLIRGLSRLSAESERFRQTKPLAVGMAVYAGLLYLADLLGLSIHLGLLSYLLWLVSVVLSLYIAYQIVRGVEDMEETFGADLAGERLKKIWTYAAALQLAALFLLIIPALAAVCLLLEAAVSIWFLAAFHRSKTLYEAIRNQR